MATLYIDTNVLLNVVNGETNPYGKDLVLPAARLFHQAISCRHQLIISSWTLKELFTKAAPEDFTMMLVLCKQKTIRVEHDEGDKATAKAKAPENWQDALHIILAERTGANYIVTRNVDDFLNIGTKIPVRKPEALL